MFLALQEYYTYVQIKVLLKRRECHDLKNTQIQQVYIKLCLHFRSVIFYSRNILKLLQSKVPRSFCTVVSWGVAYRKLGCGITKLRYDIDKLACGIANAGYGIGKSDEQASVEGHFICYPMLNSEDTLSKGRIVQGTHLPGTKHSGTHCREIKFIHYYSRSPFQENISALLLSSYGIYSITHEIAVETVIFFCLPSATSNQDF